MSKALDLLQHEIDELEQERVSVAQQQAQLQLRLDAISEQILIRQEAVTLAQMMLEASPVAMETIVRILSETTGKPVAVVNEEGTNLEPSPASASEAIPISPHRRRRRPKPYADRNRHIDYASMREQMRDIMSQGPITPNQVYGEIRKTLKGKQHLHRGTFNLLLRDMQKKNLITQDSETKQLRLNQ